MKKIIALLLALAMLFAMAACGGTANNETPDGSGAAPSGEVIVDDKTKLDQNVEKADNYLREKVTIAASVDGGTFNPYTKAAWGAVNFCIFQKLINVDSKGKIRLCALKSYEKVDDLTYNLELWDCIYDTAGNNITAEDIKWSVDYYVSLGNAGGVHRMESMEVTGKYTLTFHCNAPMGLGDLEKDLGNITVCSKAAWEASGADEMTTKPVGTGAYKLVDYVAGSTVVLEANEDFWMKNITDEAWLQANDYVTNYQNVKTVDVQIIQDAASRAVALEMGTVEAVDSLNAADVDNFLANPDLGCKSVTLPIKPPVSWYFNCSEDSPLNDVNLRKAICYALDNAAITEGLGVPAYEVYGMQPNMYDAPASWKDGREYYDYDVAKAKQLVEESSYDGSSLVFMYASGTSAFEAACVMIQSQLKEIGITVELLPVDQTVMKEYRTDTTKWDMLMDTFGGGEYLVATLKRFWTEDSAKEMNGKQVTGIVDTRLDELYVALKDDGTQEDFDAWDNYFTYEMCYGYAICCFYSQSACRADVNPVLVGTPLQLIAGAFTFTE